MKFNKKIRLTLAATGVLIFSQTVLAETAVIVNPANSVALSESDLKRIFLGKMKKFPGADTVVVVNQPTGSDIKVSFDKALLGKSASQIKAYWAKLVFSGKGNAPQELSSDAEIIKLISENPAMIGYIDAASVTDGVKVVGSY